jgi:hypothetical protein
MLVHLVAEQHQDRPIPSAAPMAIEPFCALARPNDRRAEMVQPNTPGESFNNDRQQEELPRDSLTFRP